MSAPISHPGDPHGTPSTAAVAGHPIHPMIVPFPIALLSSALLTDLAYWATGRPFWALASLWLTRAGWLTGLAAAAVGATDFFTIPRARAQGAGRIHAAGNVIALGLATLSVAVRSRRPTSAVVPAGVALSALIASILGVTGWFGGELSYRHGIGVVGRDRDA